MRYIFKHYQEQMNVVKESTILANHIAKIVGKPSNINLEYIGCDTYFLTYGKLPIRNIDVLDIPVQSLVFLF